MDDKMLRAIESLFRKVLGETGLQDKSDMHADKRDFNPNFFRVSVLAALVIGAFAIVGAFVIWAALLLILGALIAAIFEVKHWASHKRWGMFMRGASYVATIGLFLFLSWTVYYVFAVSTQVRFISGGETVVDGRSMELLNFAVQLTNKGRATSLTHWRASLSMPDGSHVEGIPNSFTGETVDIRDDHGAVTRYSLPDCDLAFETARAVQNGDTIYGVISFVFDTPPRTMPLTTAIQLRATDMLDRDSLSQNFLFGDVNKIPRDRFPCRIVSSVKQQ